MVQGKDSPKLILGTMTFGLEGTNASTSAVRIRGIENIKPFLDLFESHGYTEIDTARLYCNGDTETALGLLPMASFSIATKVFPLAPHAHSAENLAKTFRQSLAALKAKKVDIFYLHAPDYSTPFEETIKAVNDLYKEGLFERFGLSNYASWQVALIHQMCVSKGYVVPTVYQGMYNPLTRSINRELLPCLRSLNIVFYAYNPIAGGFLSGKFKFDEKVEEGSRFDSKTTFGKVYRERFWNNLFFDSVEDLKNAAKEIDSSLLDATLRWMAHHSGLGPNDGVIIGASSLEHLKENIAGYEKGPLPQSMVDAFDCAWENVKVACPSYFRTQEELEGILKAVSLNK
ncbi:hypothetical protein K7432_010952 [Basidiobolus ranarum]|uniref:NADP-dependent oxidoreductase domain-containing protein n=1 Tax=Basidiobolus ranarum TaxID=34480 RepID=A0ABR2VUU1_9FUNG